MIVITIITRKIRIRMSFDSLTFNIGIFVDLL